MPDESRFQDYATLLQHLNVELSERFDELPGDVQALLVQKGTISHAATRELAELLSESLERMAALTDKCKDWRDNFMLPLLDQTDDKPVVHRVDSDDLLRLINEISEIIGE
jgi:hypothetical protein